MANNLQWLYSGGPSWGPSMDALVFDAYGTLFDVASLHSACEAVWPGRGEAVGRARGGCNNSSILGYAR